MDTTPGTIGRAACGHWPTRDYDFPTLQTNGTREPKRVTCKRCLRLLGREVCQ